MGKSNAERLRLLIELCNVWCGNLTALWQPLSGWTLLAVGPNACGQATLLQAYGNSDGQSPPDGQLRLPTQGAIRFGKVREMCLRVRSVEEAAQVERLGARLRILREALGCSRMELAQHLRLDLEVIVAVENGYGNLETAKRLIELAAKIPPAKPVAV
jgi:DNA-binding XRE family transcriptional regulator